MDGITINDINPEWLNVLWFALLGVLLTGYAVLDGFDFGVGALHLFTKTDHDRRILLNSIGPFWDGNEVWLVTFGGAMFAAFPNAYAAVFSGFYLPFMILLFALIFRAIAVEFRSKLSAKLWRNFWDVAFCLASGLCALLFGVAVGNMIRGVAVRDGMMVGEFIELLNPYSLLVGLLTVALFMMHGAIYLNLKTEGELQKKVKEWAWPAWGTFTALYMFTTIVTLVSIPNAANNFQNYPWAWAIVLLNVIAIANIPRSLYHNYPGEAFISSCIAIVALNGLLGMALFPNLVTSSIGAEHSINIVNAASSTKTLGIMGIIALIGMPLVLSYTIAIYYAFRGKTKLTEHSY